MRQPVVYMLASRRNGTIYTGVTSNLPQRLAEHRDAIRPGFTTTYGVRRLVWYEPHALMADAIVREKRIKEWQRAWKIRLIEAANPEWNDLSSTLSR